MNQDKIGKFIADMRKKKKMTQEELANKIHVSNKAVSKWETGRGIPDYSLLNGLCEALNVSLVELLNGEETVLKEDMNINNTMVDGIKFYGNTTRKKYIKICFFISFIFLLIVSLLLFLYVVNNYNKIKVYSINTIDVLDLNGTIIFNPKQKCFIIHEIYYNDIYTGTDLELKVKGLEIKFVSKNNIIMESGNLDFIDTNEVKTINDYLSDISIINMEIIEPNENYIKEEDLEDLEIILEYVDESGKLFEFKYPIQSYKAFANTDLFY